MRVGGLAAIATAIAIGVVIATSGGGPSPGTANLWVDADGGSCTRSATAVGYVDAAACSSINTANQAASPTAGDRVLVKCGSYGVQIFAADASHTSMTVAEPETPYCATLQGTSSTTVQFASVRWVTLQYFTILDSTTGGVTISDTASSGSSLQSQHVSLIGNKINVGVKVKGNQIVLHAPQNWLISDNIFGPSCCGITTPASPVPITIGKVNSGEAPDCTTQACNVTITKNLIQFALRTATLWPSSGWGTVPDSSCLIAACHLDSIHIWGCSNCTISYNRIYGDECTGIFIENVNNSAMGPMDIIGNAITAMAAQCNGALGFNFVGTVLGPWNIKFNSLGAQANLFFNTTATFTVNLIGNYGRLFVNGPGVPACSGGTGGPNVTFNFEYDAWTTSNACGVNDVANAAASWVDSSPAPAVSQDMHLNGGPAVDFVPASVTGGCPSTDFDGDTPGSPCNAGADQ